MGSSRTLYNYFYLFLVIVWPPLQLYVIHIDNLGRTIAILNILTLLSIFFSKKMFNCVKSKYTVFWLLWIFVELFVLFKIKGYHYYYYQQPILFILKDVLSPLVVMYVAMYEAKNNWVGLCKVLVIAYIFYIIFTALGGLSFSMEDRNLTGMGNSFPAAMVSLVFLSLMLLTNKKGKGVWLLLIGFIALFLIFVSGSRKSLISAIIIIVFAYLAFQNQLNIYKMIRLAVVLVIAYYAISYLFENTFYAERFEESLETGEQSNNTDIRWLSFLGDRAIMYIDGFELFKNNPLLGIGLTNYYYYGTVHQMMHSEYMTQLTECGLVGSILFIVFYGQILKGLFSKNTLLSRNNRRMMIGFMFACLFTAFTAWIYSSTSIYIVYGIIISFITNNIKNENTRCQPQS